jgi:hypothetical protein
MLTCVYAAAAAFSQARSCVGHALTHLRTLRRGAARVEQAPLRGYYG